MQRSKDKNVFNFTKSVGKRRINLTVEELTTNVKKLVEHALTLTPSSSDNPDEENIPILVGRNIKMYLTSKCTSKAVTVQSRHLGLVMSFQRYIYSFQGSY